MSQLRSFKYYNNTAAVNITAPDGRGPIPCALVDLDGTYSGAGGEWLQMFDLAATPGAGAVPLKSLQLMAAGPVPLPSLFQELGPITFTLGCWIGISSTQRTYTASASAFDVFGEISEWEMPRVSPMGTAISTAGDLSTAINTLQLWAEATPSTDQRVYRVIAKNVLNDGKTRYLRIEPTDAAIVGLGLTMPKGIAPNGGVSVFDMGFAGTLIHVGFNQNPNTLKKGCTLRLVDSELDAYQQTSSSGNILAYYS
jgi:hypothetical protein